IDRRQHIIVLVIDNAGHVAQRVRGGDLPVQGIVAIAGPVPQRIDRRQDVVGRVEDGGGPVTQRVLHSDSTMERVQRVGGKVPDNLIHPTAFSPVSVIASMGTSWVRNMSPCWRSAASVHPWPWTWKGWSAVARLT